MEKHFGDWYRVVGIDADHNKLNKRWKGVESFAGKADRACILSLARLFHDLPSAEEVFVEGFATVFQKLDNAFPMQNNALELSLLAGASLSSVLGSGKEQLADVAALAATCPAFRRKREKPPIPEVLDRAWNHLVQRRSSLRDPGPMDVMPIEEPDADAMLKDLDSAFQTNDLSQIGGQVTKSLRTLSTLLVPLVKTVNQLQWQQKLYREDSNVLWWMTGGHSCDLNRPFAKIETAATALLIGKELADLVRVMPGPLAAEAVMDRSLADAGCNRDETITLADAVNKTDRDWREAWVKQVGGFTGVDLCPTTLAVKSSVEIPDDEKTWQTAFRSSTGLVATTSIKPLELAVQVYEECLFVKVVQA